jgi:drug/metabolite transporter (DMT)-like permease
LALFSAAAFALSHVVSKRGLHDTSVTAGFIVVVSCAWLVISVPAAAQLPVSMSAGSVALFALSGLFAPGIARAATLAGVKLLGPSIAVPIQQGLRPLIVLPVAALFLGEELGPWRVLGAAIIVLGGWILTRQPQSAENHGSGASALGMSPISEQGKRMPTVSQQSLATAGGFRPGLVYPVVAAIAFAASDVLVKGGLDEGSVPAIGAAISTGTGLLLWYLAHSLPVVRRRFRLGSRASWLAMSGALMGAAILLLFVALDRGDVSLVAPIIASQPLFVFLFSSLFLRNLEHLERSTVVAGAIVVAGMVLVLM